MTAFGNVEVSRAIHSDAVWLVEIGLQSGNTVLCGAVLAVDAGYGVEIGGNEDTERTEAGSRQVCSPEQLTARLEKHDRSHADPRRAGLEGDRLGAARRQGSEVRRPAARRATGSEIKPRYTESQHFYRLDSAGRLRLHGHFLRG